MQLIRFIYRILIMTSVFLGNAWIISMDHFSKESRVLLEIDPDIKSACYMPIAYTENHLIFPNWPINEPAIVFNIQKPEQNSSSQVDSDKRIRNIDALKNQHTTQKEQSLILCHVPISVIPLTNCKKTTHVEQKYITEEHVLGKMGDLLLIYRVSVENDNLVIERMNNFKNKPKIYLLPHIEKNTTRLFQASKVIDFEVNGGKLVHGSNGYEQVPNPMDYIYI